MALLYGVTDTNRTNQELSAAVTAGTPAKDIDGIDAIKVAAKAVADKHGTQVGQRLLALLKQNKSLFSTK